MRAVLAIVIALSLATAFVMAQITAPSAVDYALGSYQVAGGNTSGAPLESYGWNPDKRGVLNLPVRVRVRVDSTSGVKAFYRVAVNYFGNVDTVYHNCNMGAAFWLPVGGTGIPDSLFYAVPSANVVGGNEFTVSSVRIKAGDFYNFRLIYASDTVKGTQTLTSQPIWIGHGVSSLTFGYNPVDTVAVVYRTSYALTHGGPFLSFASSDTLADSTWTVDSTQAGTLNYRAPTGIDVTRWMKVDRIGQVAADTVQITDEEIYIQSR